MKPSTVLVFASVAVVLVSSLASATSIKRDLHIRGKRSFSWLPFFGRSSSSETEPENANDESLPQPPQYASDGSIVPDASAINAIVARGQVINNQVHYPIWRVHKYNGIHLRPLPVSLVQDQQRVDLPTYDEPESNSIGSTDGNKKPASGPIPLELLSLAKEFGITDFSQLPDLEEAMNLLGTTTQEETIETIKELAATESGRELIKQFLGNSRDKEAAASAKEEDTVQGDATLNVPQFLLPQQGAGGLLSAFVPRNSGDDGEEPSSSNPNIFQRITQIGSFLNPFAGREEIPLPPTDGDTEAAGEIVSGEREPDVILTRNDDVVDADTVAVPSLPELPPLPAINGLNANVPDLPELHIPRHAIAPRGGAYVRVKLPLSGFNPTPSIPIDPKYLYHYQNQLLRQRQQSHLLQQQPPRQQFLPYNGYTSGNGPVVAQQFTIPTDPRHRAQAAYNAGQAAYGAGQSAYNVGQLPLVRDANYEVFKNAPRITTSYGAPALPYTYSLDKSVNTYQPSPISTNSFIHQEFELRPAGSERVEQTSQPPINNDQTNRPDKTQNQNQKVIPRSANDGRNAAIESIEPVTEEVVEVVTPEVLKSLSNAPALNSIDAAEDQEEQQPQKEQQAVGPKRITSYDTFATGKVHKADPKAIELLPFTVRHMLNEENFEQN